ncbi:transposase [Nocardia abscessus]|uniref:transposase n=1 Tax=Nocardia abscessus TaxID=120957 RepID=UPI003CC7CB9E
MPGFGPILGSMLLAATGDLRAFPSAGHLAAAAGLVPVPNDSSRRTGTLHRPRRYSRPLRHASIRQHKPPACAPDATVTTSCTNVHTDEHTPKHSSPHPGPPPSRRALGHSGL